MTEGNTAVKPADPTRGNYNFTGWYTDQALTNVYDFGTSVTADITLYAKWDWTGDGITLPYTDINQNLWYNKAICYTYQNGLMAGTSNTTFEPASSLTREMFVTILYRMAGNMGMDTSAPASSFSDVPVGQWYSDAIAWGASNNIVGGYDSNTFGLGDNVTREQMAALFVRFAEYAGITLGTDSGSTFSDSSTVSGWAVNDVIKASAAGLFSGDNGNFKPLANATRAEAAQVFMNFCQLYVD